MSFHSSTSQPVYRNSDLREIEAAALAAQPSPPLMERAGLAAAQIARRVGADRGRGVLVIAGPGNNGGDAFVVARHLKAWWYNVDVVFAGDPAKLPADARAAFDAWRDGGGTTQATLPADGRWNLVVDGLFGIGLQRDLTGAAAALVTAINGLGCRVLALDVPSGLDSDTGGIRGCAVRADHTATFIGLKPGLLTLHGPDQCGEIHVCTLDLDTPQRSGAVIGDDAIRAVLPARRANTHKGDYGSVGIIGGAPGMAGAAVLAGRAALQLGAGRVYVGLLGDEARGYDPVQPELMLRPAREILMLEHLTALAVGPGLGVSPDAQRLLAQALQVAQPLVLDADALNLMAADPKLQQLAAQRTAPTLLTPHPAEAARLLARGTPAVQADRVASAGELAARYKSAVVLKGAGSICALPDGTWFVNTTGNPGMASAGMGDVLTGFIAALLAQGAAATTALLAAVHLHGAAGDALRAAHGQIGMTAGECIAAARTLLNHA
jgi:ADP-dependent NAD(P)H-hydrate dehydratase / NAD(P)H-hydrate epimerase